MKTIEEAILAASSCLQAVGIENPRLESEFLIAAYLQVPRTRIILDRHHHLSDQKIRGFQNWLSERQKRKPLAYVSGCQPFRDLTLKVTPSVLVPRPETELVVEQALRMLDRMEGELLVVDVGTGSGAIALSLSMHAKVRRVIGIDASTDALKIARENASQVQRSASIEWLEGNLLEPIRARRLHPDLIVANLPYVTSLEMQALEPELHWEPRMALDGGADGLRFIEPCIAEAGEILKPGGILLLEIGSEQSSAVMALFNQTSVWVEPQVFRDFAGLPRIVQAKRSATEARRIRLGRHGGKEL